ncbi:uncharacterized protein K441DRAFT_656916, partial [Cenococcum geophilum 1.58]|uniref:uncharacterized protein n=1 Tax=Cenococcum geophilum 1.58 TaxID=794803 RepID=UPI00358F06C4
VRARVITTLNHNNVLGQCRDSTSLPIRRAPISQVTAVKTRKFSSFQSLKVLVLTVLGPSYLYPYYIALR